MTRLRTEWIHDLENTAAAWDARLQEQIGMGYVELAAKVSGKSPQEIKSAAKNRKIAVVPITSGLGTIGSFSESVAAIVRAMGFHAVVTEATDVNGIYEAVDKIGADVLYMADDDRYLALSCPDGKTGDNNIATAQGYVEVLAKMAGGLRGRRTAVLGYGIIGKLMAEALAQKGARVAVYDKEKNKQKEVLADGYQWIKDSAGLKEYRYVADATSEGGWLTKEMLHADAHIAAPGIPLSLDDGAREALKGQYVHDLLEIGTVGMLGMAL